MDFINSRCVVVMTADVAVAVAAVGLLVEFCNIFITVVAMIFAVGEFTAEGIVVVELNFGRNVGKIFVATGSSVAERAVAIVA